MTHRPRAGAARLTTRDSRSSMMTITISAAPARQQPAAPFATGRALQGERAELPQGDFCWEAALDAKAPRVIAFPRAVFYPRDHDALPCSCARIVPLSKHPARLKTAQLSTQWIQKLQPLCQQLQRLFRIIRHRNQRGQVELLGSKA